MSDQPELEDVTEEFLELQAGYKGLLHFVTAYMMQEDLQELQVTDEAMAEVGPKDKLEFERNEFYSYYSVRRVAE